MSYKIVRKEEAIEEAIEEATEEAVADETVAVEE